MAFAKKAAVKTPASPAAPLATPYTPPTTPQPAPAAPPLSTMARRTAQPAPCTTDLSATMGRRVDQTPQTVGSNPDAPATTQSSGQVNTMPLAMPGNVFGSQPYSGLIG